MKGCNRAIGSNSKETCGKPGFFCGKLWGEPLQNKGQSVEEFDGHKCSVEKPA
jgi:hypothetical protein